MAQPPFMGARISMRSPSAKRHCGRCALWTITPLCAVASQLTSYSSSDINSARVTAEISRSSPLTVSFIQNLLGRMGVEDDVGCLSRHRRRQQESVAVKAVDADRRAVSFNAREIVRIGWSQPGAGLHYFSFRECGMQ